MGIIQGCNLCKTPKEVGEINTNGLKDNIKAKQLFETKVKNTKDITIINNMIYQRLYPQWMQKKII